MPRIRSSAPPAQRGAITILVALMLLVLLTISAIGMSRNSLREVIISGTSRQGAMTRNLADSGIEWGIYWMDPTNALSNPGSGTPQSLIALKTALLADDTKSGRSYNAAYSSPTRYTESSPPAPPTDLRFTTVTTASLQGYSVALTRMGKLPVTDMSQGVSQGTFTPAQGSVTRQAPDLWAVRADAQVTAGLTFQHAKEAWISTPVQ